MTTTFRTARSRTALAGLAGGALVVGGLGAAGIAADTRVDRGAQDTTYALPDGFQPEGIATGKGPTAYLGSLADGDIYALDLRSGKGQVISEGPGTSSVGLKVETRQNRLYVAGGDTGTARIVDAGSGDMVADYTLTDGPAFINDVVLTKRAAYFTNSAAPELYRVPITKKGRLPAEGAIRTISLRGDFEQPEGFGANGITRTPDGKAVLVVNSNDGTLFRVATRGKRAGAARLVDLGGQSLTSGDGMLLRNRTLYVVRNRLNKVIELRLSKTGLSGRKTGVRRSSTFDVPTTIALKRGRLLLPNARFGTTPTADTEYTVSSLQRR
ncbi:superoxide dismutase [Nocardioides sp.]|uniref:YncE family protein n=1 Tax=Nocardioides sp. TaxID=35761 RepID=UPI002B278DF6|nr:superoxide dismutase [Nocardioides sp.]